MAMQFLLLKVITGDFNAGFTVALDVESHSNGQVITQQKDFYGTLPTATPSLLELYQDWAWEITSPRPGQARRRRGIRVISTQAVTTSYQYQGQGTERKVLHQSMVQWLASPLPAWQNLEKEILRWLSQPDGETHLILQVSQSLYQESPETAAILAKLPWQEWPLLQSASQKVHFAVNTCQYGSTAAPASVPSPSNFQATLNRYLFPELRILHLIGNSDGIDLKPDQQVLANLAVNKGNRVKITELLQPDYPQLSCTLRQSPGFDLFVYSGHSEASYDQELAAMLFAGREGVTIPDLQLSFQQAIANGLQVAIFNSCASAQLAEALLDYGITTVISMKEEVPDPVAHQFLDSFFRYYAGQNHSLFNAVRQSLTDLEEFDRLYPGVGWLPVIHQSPRLVPPVWQKLREPARKVRRIGVSSLVITLLVVAMRLLGLTQGLDLKLFDWLLRTQPVTESVDDRLVVVTVDQNDLDILRQNGLQSEVGNDVISDGALAEALERINTYQPQWIGLDIIRDLTISQEDNRLEEVLGNNKQIIPTCGFADQHGEELLPPPGMDGDRLAFINMPIDRDQVIRRQLLFRQFAQNAPCPTNQSLALSLALSYLGQEDISPAESPILTLNNVAFTPLEAKSGVYRGNEVEDYQILFRSLPRGAIREISLSTLFADTENRLNLKNKVVLLGYSHKDKHSINLENNIPGVVIHAQMTKQILDAVLEGKPLLIVASLPLELLWILLWSGLATGGIVGVIVMDGVPSGDSKAARRSQQLVAIVALLGVTGSTWLVLWAGGLWLPLASPLLILALLLGLTTVGEFDRV
jgi:CHASE2 domain-containing sensor protein